MFFTLAVGPEVMVEAPHQAVQVVLEAGAMLVLTQPLIQVEVAVEALVLVMAVRELLF